MIARKAKRAVGWRVYGLGVIGLGMVTLVLRDFDPGQPVPDHFPDRVLLTYAAGVFMVAMGAVVEWRRFTAWGAAAITVYYTLVVVILMNGYAALGHFAEFGTYSNIAEQLAIAAGGLIIYANNAVIDIALAARLTRVGQQVFSVCAVLFGLAHFVFLNLTVPLVPKWLPPGQLFWAYATGMGHIAAGMAILSRVQARLAAMLLTAMYISFTVLVHVPMLVADPSSHWILTENVLNIALIGVAWVVADSLKRPNVSDGSLLARGHQEEKPAT